MKILVSVPSRVHMTLIELGLQGYRRNGGIGFAIEAPAHCLEFASADVHELRNLCGLGFTDAEVERCCAILDEVKHAHRLPYSVRLATAIGPKRHVGMGSGTAVMLACVEALFYANKVRIGQSDLIRISRRGGTSGIGIHTYFDGGFVVDMGRPFDAQAIASSDDIPQPNHPARLLCRYAMPSWRVGMLFPPNESLTADQERAVFASLIQTPISPAEIHETAYHSIFGAAAAVVATDFEAFCKSVNALQSTAWKRREIEAHGSAFASIMNRMRELGCECVGLSSMGPGLYFFAADFDAISENLRQEFPGATIFDTVAVNRGREIRYA